MVDRGKCTKVSFETMEIWSLAFETLPGLTSMESETPGESESETRGMRGNKKKNLLKNFYIFSKNRIGPGVN